MTSVGRTLLVYGLYGQWFDASGEKQGPTFQLGYGGEQSIAAARSDSMLVVWTRQSPTNSIQSVFGRFLDVHGQIVGDEFEVGEGDGGRVIADPDGGFLVAWRRTTEGGTELWARGYSALGQAEGEPYLLRSMPGWAFLSAAAISADDSLAVAWTVVDQSYLQSFDSHHRPLHEPALITTRTREYWERPTINVSATYGPDNRLYVAVSEYAFYDHWGAGTDYFGVSSYLFLRCYSEKGLLIGDTSIGSATFFAMYQSPQPSGYNGIELNTSPTLSLGSDGQPVLTWKRFEPQGTGQILSQRFSAAGAPFGEPSVVHSGLPELGSATATMNPNGLGAASWSEDTGLYFQYFDVRPAVAGVKIASNGSELLVAEGGTVQEPLRGLTVSFARPLNTEPGSAGSALNPSNWRVLQNGQDVSHRIRGITWVTDPASSLYEAQLSLALPLGNGEITLVASGAILDTSGFPLDGDGDGQPGGDFRLNFRIVVPPIRNGPELLVNSTTAGDQQLASVSRRAVERDAAGNFVVAWAAQQPKGDGWDVYARRFDPAGAPQGDEFRLNTSAAGNQFLAGVAMDPDGDFVVSWSGAAPGASYGVYARRYNKAGQALGDEFSASTPTAGDQRYSQVALASDGSFAIAWSWLVPGLQNLVALRRFAADGAPLGDVLLVDPQFGPLGSNVNQLYPALALDPSGKLLVTYAESQGDPSGFEVRGRRYDAQGQPLGDSFLVNQTFAGDQSNPAIGVDAQGRWVVTWSSQGQDASGWGVAARQFDDQGAPLDSEFLVNTATAGDQLNSTVAVAPQGDFTIAWSSRDQDASGWGVYAQRFSASGHRLGVERRLNTTTTGDQMAASVATSGNGDLVAVWTSAVQDGEAGGIYAQRFTAAVAVLLGDANGDQKVDLSDFGLLKQHFGAAGDRATGDFDGDGVIGLGDFGFLKENFGRTGEQGQTPALPPDSVHLLAADVPYLFEPVADAAASAQALAASGAEMYGAFWCPHCHAQEDLFGDGAIDLPYVECSKPDHTRNQTAIDNNITSYPTWVFADGSRHMGEMPLDELSAACGVLVPMISAQTEFQQALDRIMHQFGQTGSRLSGDLDQDGRVDLDDFGLAKDNRPAAAGRSVLA